MKRAWIWAAITLACWIPETAHSYLHDRSSGLIYDDVLNVTWLQDANLAFTSGFDADGLMTASVANAWAENLIYRGYSDWRLPAARNFDGTDPYYGWNITTHEMGYLFYVELGNHATMNVYTLSGLDNTGPFRNLAAFRYWSNTAYYLSPSFWWYFNFGSGYQWDAVAEAESYAWAVRDGDVSSVPLPSTIVFLFPALVAWALVRNKGKAAKYCGLLSADG